MKTGKNGFYCRYLKRILDIICALAAIIFFGWLYIIVAILVYFKLGKPIVFKQERPGKAGKIFTLYKFRSMTEKRNKEGNLLPDDKRLTHFGLILRKTSLDELPEVINILKGDMSVIGPRPLAVRYLPYYSKTEMHRHDVRPGLSGIAQVHGRNSVLWEKRFSYDLEYVNNVSFGLDCKLVMETLIIVFKRSGVEVRKSDGTMDFDKYRIAEYKGGTYEYRG